MIVLPQRCLRGLGCCSPLSQIASDDETTFVCVGENDGSDRTVDQDGLTLCVRSAAGVDLLSHCDERDLIDQTAVLAGAISVLANRRLSSHR